MKVDDSHPLPDDTLLNLMSIVTDKLVKTLAFDDALGILIDGAMELLAVERASIMILDQTTNELSIKTAKGMDLELVRSVRIPVGSGIAGSVAESGQPLLIEDVRRHPKGKVHGEERPGYADYSAISVPLTIHGEVRGVMNFNNRTDHRPLGQRELSLAALISNQAAVMLYMAMLHETAVVSEKFEQELCIARETQERFLPAEAPQFPGFRLAGLCSMCSHVGGDYYDFVAMGEGRLAIAVGDVAGHGMPSALQMANARAFLRSRLAQHDDIAKTLDDLNKFLASDTNGDMFMTMAVGILDTESRTLQLVNAGHPMPIMMRDGEILPMPIGGRNLPLGIEDDWKYEPEDPIEILPGDLLLLFTDGTWEAVNPQGEEFGEEGLCRTLIASDARSESDLLNDIIADVRTHCDHRAQRDDYTLIAIRGE